MKCHLCGANTESLLKLRGLSSITSLGRILKADAEISLCSVCSHCQTTPSIDLAEYYSTDYKTLLYSADEDDLYALKEDGPVFRNQHMANTFIVKLSKLMELDSKVNILDFGCGKSLAMRHVHGLVPKVNISLYDVSRDYIHFWQDFIPRSRYACYEMPSEWYLTFDVVTSFFSLEHVEKPTFELKKICKVLKPSGVVYIVVPNMYSENTADMLVIDHVQHYSQISMRVLLQASGLDLLSLDNESHNQASIYIAKRSGTPNKTDFSLDDIGRSLSQARRIAKFWSDVSHSLEMFEANQCRGNSKYFIVGAGIIGTYILSRLKCRDRVAGFIDSNKFKQTKGWQTIPVFSPGEVQGDAQTIVFSGFNTEQVRTVLPGMLPTGTNPSNIWTVNSSGVTYDND